MPKPAGTASMPQTLDLAQEAGLFTKEARAEFESEWYIRSSVNQMTAT